MPIKKKLPKDPSFDTQGQRLQRLLEGYNKAHIARAIDYSVTALSRVMNDHAGMSDEKLAEIAAYIGKDFDEVRVDKVTDKALRKLTIDHVLKSKQLQDSFVRAPLDKTSRKWVIYALSMVKEFVDENREALIHKDGIRRAREARITEARRLKRLEQHQAPAENMRAVDEENQDAGHAELLQHPPKSGGCIC